MSHRKNLRNCQNCGTRHGPPTGAMCRFGPMAEVQGGEGLPAADQAAEPAAVFNDNGDALPQLEERAALPQDDRLARRVDDLVRLLMASMQINQHHQPRLRAREAADIDSHSSTDDETRERGRARPASHRRRGKFDHKRFSETGEPIDSFERLMVVTMRTTDYMVRENLDISGMIQHVTCISEKAAKNIYKIEAI